MGISIDLNPYRHSDMQQQFYLLQCKGEIQAKLILKRQYQKTPNYNTDCCTTIIPAYDFQITPDFITTK